ncbi:27697_t:CDS:2 [Gigaspora margarita]|uniref:27697_t:CDS:1 n=1 Tax=Gigaspora margarita TaxID=4874 RepID=A0ABN7UZ99_GIGMA|nr:27697_t:CDS:2 [Gigaspora margarita]
MARDLHHSTCVILANIISTSLQMHLSSTIRIYEVIANRSRNNGFLTAIKIYKPYPRLSFYDCGAGINNTSSNDMEPKVVVKQVVKEILAGDGIYSPSEINGSIDKILLYYW